MSSVPPQTDIGFPPLVIEALAHCKPASQLARKIPARTVGESCSRFGVCCAAKGITYRLARRLGGVQVGHVLVQDITELRATPTSAAGLDYRWLTADEVRDYAADRANDLDAAMASSLKEQDNYCFAALDGPVLANYSWYALGSIQREHSLGAGLSFPNDTVYFYKAYTRPEYRGRGLHPTALRIAASFFAQHSISRLVAIVEYANWASLRSHAKLGFRSAGRFVKVGGNQPRFERYPQLAESLGIRFGNN